MSEKLNTALTYLYGLKPWWSTLYEKMKTVEYDYEPVMSIENGELVYGKRYVFENDVKTIAATLDFLGQKYIRSLEERLHRQLGDPLKRDIASVSIALEINGELEESYKALDANYRQARLRVASLLDAPIMEERGLSDRPMLSLLDPSLTAASFDLEPGLSAESYFTELYKREQELESEQLEYDVEQTATQPPVGEENDDASASDSSGGDDSSGEASIGGDSSPDDAAGGDADQNDDRQGAGSESSAEAEDDRSDDQGSDESSSGGSGDEELDDSPSDGAPGTGQGSASGEATETEHSESRPGPSSGEPAKMESSGDQSGSSGSSGSYSGTSPGSAGNQAEGDSGSSDSQGTERADAVPNEDGGESPPDATGGNGPDSRSEADGGSSGQSSEKAEQGPQDSNEGSERPVTVKDRITELLNESDIARWQCEGSHNTQESQPEVKENIARIAKDIDRLSGRPGLEGMVTPTMEKWAAKHLPKRRKDWSSVLRKAVSTSVSGAAMSGQADMSYAKRNMNQSDEPGSPIMMGMVTYPPNAMILVDSSPSMRAYKDSVLPEFVNIVKKVTISRGAPCDVVAADAEISWAARGLSKTRGDLSHIFNGKRGTTDLADVLLTIASKGVRWNNLNIARPDIIVMLTDCKFDWPMPKHTRLPGRYARVVVASTETYDRLIELGYTLPKWLVPGKNFVYIDE